MSSAKNKLIFILPVLTDCSKQTYSMLQFGIFFFLKKKLYHIDLFNSIIAKRYRHFHHIDIIDIAIRSIDEEWPIETLLNHHSLFFSVELSVLYWDQMFLYGVLLNGLTVLVVFTGAQGGSKRLIDVELCCSGCFG
ncbi:hypothetical protein F4703DRAFT_1796861 [Phycomyces blakesleeanus]